MEKFTYQNLSINTRAVNKWYIYYRIIFDNGIVEKRKEYGKKFHLSLNTISNLKERQTVASRLLGVVENFLNKGIDPKYAVDTIDQRNVEKLKQIQKAEDARISIAAAIKMLKDEKGWNNPAMGKEKTAASIPTFLNNQLKPYFERIGKADDVREVTRIDLKTFIEENFNPADGSKGWSSSSAAIYKAWTSILFAMLVDHELVATNPVTGIKIKTDKQKRNQVEGDDAEQERFEPWADIEVKHWFDDLAKSDNIIERNVLASSALIHYAFIRKTELLRLKCWMIDFDNERITLPPAITKSERKYKSRNLIHVDMPDALVTILLKWMAFRFPNGHGDDDYILGFTSDTKEPYKYVTFTNHFILVRKQFQKKYEGLYIRKNQYALKHNGVAKLFNALTKTNKTPNDIQNIIRLQCRHSSFSQTETYLSKLKLEFKEQRNKINF
ncbi:hypothetical protein [Pedobacter sp. CFBP9032]|uniref:hypothetical protein n=1 Tax=Pedobacter sp. CFBP9032 TaxID=3096539 RepID=UPI002A6AB014|nr:hypothetical protein [Pedobacter sp. CFBP9032]MDY0905637.1 hypothetical protein [Pedobacter sp. CFBP9032]